MRRIASLHLLKLDREADPEKHRKKAVELARKQHIPKVFSPLIHWADPKMRSISLRKRRVAEAGHIHDEDAQQREAAKNVDLGYSHRPRHWES
jgi:hypothetical protein